jgi:hypothetical protein
MPEEMVLDEVAAPEIDETPAESTELGEESPDTEVVEEAEEQGDETEGESEEESEGDEPVEGQQQAQDGRKMPDGLKKAIASLKTTSPETAKQIKGLYYSDQEYRAAFAKPEDAVAAKNLIEEIGGQEGIQEIAAEREEWQKIDADFSEGKPEFVKSLAEGNPEAFLKTAPHVINEFATRAPEQYAYYANRLTLNTMSNAGLSLQNLHGAYERYKESNPEAAGVIAEVYNAMHDMNSKAAQFEQKRTDPREEQLKQREQEFENKRRADFETSVAGQAEKYLGEKMQPEIDRIVGNRKVDPEAMKEFQGMVQRKVGELLAAIPGIEDKLEAYYRTGDAQKSVAYVQSQYTRLIPQAAKVIEPFLRNIAPAAARQAPKQGTGKSTASPEPGTVTLKEMPTWDQLDPEWRSRVESTAEWMQGRAVLKSGKKATGWA